MVATRDFGAIFWHMPTLGALTLAHVERGGIVAMMILVVTGFWFRDLKVARLRWVDCSLTSTELVMLGMTWFAILGPTGLCIER